MIRQTNAVSYEDERGLEAYLAAKSLNAEDSGAERGLGGGVGLGAGAAAFLACTAESPLGRSER